jgi:type II secretory pathway component PulK
MRTAGADIQARPGRRVGRGLVPVGQRPTGFVLPIVLMVLILLGLLVAGFAFDMHANVASTQAVAHRVQTRMAAEAGIQRVMLLLRDNRLNVDAWFHNPDELHRVIVWMAGEQAISFGLPSELEDTEDEPAFRFSIVADDPFDDEERVRFGLTDEGAKLNLNTASAGQLRTLIAQVAPQDAVVDELVDALIDWRDADDQRSPNGAEAEYYLLLETSYEPKNGNFDTVEELLMVKGFDGRVLYGEDYDRNGLLSVNEDDGDETFPLDDTDGRLNRGLYPYITVRSREFNVANDNKPRLIVGASSNGLPEGIEEFFSEQETAYMATVLGLTGEQKPTSPADFMYPPAGAEIGVANPFEPEDLPRLLDRLSFDPRAEIHGMININTAPPEVLRCVSLFTEEMVADIVALRAELTAEAKQTTAWLLTSGVVDIDTFKGVSQSITARAAQFTVEVLGYADHIGTISRLQALLEMRGPVAQVVYFRDLTPLGPGYPVRSRDRIEGENAGDFESR